MGHGCGISLILTLRLLGTVRKLGVQEWDLMLSGTEGIGL